MNVPFALEFGIGVLLGVVIITIVMVLLQLRATKQFNRLSQPAYEYMQQQAEREAADLLHSAKDAAMKVEAEATAQRDALLQDFRSELAAIKDTYKDTLAAAVQEERQSLQTVHTEHAAELRDQTKAALKVITDAITPLQADVMKLNQTVTEVQTAIETTARESAGAVSKSVHEAVAAAEAAIQQEQAAVVAAIESQGAKLQTGLEEAVAAYRTEREQIVDRHIMQIVEAVAKRVLHAELTTQEHAELAKKALQQAKVDKTLM